MTSKSSAVEIDMQVIYPTPLHGQNESLERVKSLCQKLPQVNMNTDHPLISVKINYLVENRAIIQTLKEG